MLQTHVLYVSLFIYGVHVIYVYIHIQTLDIIYIYIHICTIHQYQYTLQIHRYVYQVCPSHQVDSLVSHWPSVMISTSPCVKRKASAACDGPARYRCPGCIPAYQVICKKKHGCLKLSPEHFGSLQICQMLFSDFGHSFLLGLCRLRKAYLSLPIYTYLYIPSWGSPCADRPAFELF